MKNLVSRCIKGLARKAGFELRRIPTRAGKSLSSIDPYAAQATLIGSLGIREPLVFDVGANRGQAAAEYRRVFPGAKIHCFEPFPVCVDVLRERFSADPGVTIVPSGIADQPGNRVFHVNGSDATNSLLARPNEGRRYFSDAARTIEKIEVPVTTLDEYVGAGDSPEPDILKLDIQGGERLALAGARKLLEEGKIPVVFTEILFVPLYEGCALFHELSAILDSFGYTLVNLFDTQVATNGQLRFGDALFVSPDAREKVIDQFPEEP